MNPQALNETICKHPFFHGMKPQHLTQLGKGALESSYRTGETLFKEGEPANRCFLVKRGNIALEAHQPANGTVVVHLVSDGEALGWSWLFPPFTWHLRARALEPTSVIVLDGAHLLGLAEEDHDFGYDLMKRVSQMVIHRLDAAQRRLLATEVESTLQGA